MSTGIFLGVETSGNLTGLALVQSGRVLAEVTEEPVHGHNETLIPLIEAVLARSGLSVRDLAGIGVAVGPGLFISLRVGLSAVKGLAIAHGTPVKGIGTLPALALSVPAEGRIVLAVMDARKEQVYSALFDADRRPLIEPCLAFPGDLARSLATMAPAGHVVIVTGNGSGLIAAAAEQAGVALERTSVVTPSAVSVAAEASRLIGAGLFDDLATLEPLYLRRTDAELNRESKARAG